MGRKHADERVLIIEKSVHKNIPEKNETPKKKDGLSCFFGVLSSFRLFLTHRRMTENHFLLVSLEDDPGQL